MRFAFFAVALLLVAPGRSVAETTQEMLSACRDLSTARVTGDQVSLPQDFGSGRCWGAFDVIQTQYTAHSRASKVSSQARDASVLPASFPR
jgi:hypothetical protein